MAKRNIVGWAEGQDRNKFFDGTQVFHAIVEEDGFAFPACNRNITFGGCFSQDQIVGRQRCRRCVKIANKK